MITELSLQRFKAFSSMEGLQLRPLTILCGKNSTGKSSILQSLLLLKQSMIDQVSDEAVALEGPYLAARTLLMWKGASGARFFSLGYRYFLFFVTCSRAGYGVLAIELDSFPQSYPKGLQ